MGLLATADNLTILDEVSPGYGAAKMQSLKITLRLPVSQLHSDQELIKNVFMPVITTIVINHGTDIGSFSVVFNHERENLVCDVKFWGNVDVKAVEKEWNQLMDEYGYTEASKAIGVGLSRVGLSKELFFAPSTFVAEY